MAAFFIVTGVVFLLMPLIWVGWKWGERCRREQQKRLARCKEWR
jgi:hypothetical protein